jgi:hypothetical protein
LAAGNHLDKDTPDHDAPDLQGPDL